MSEMPHFQSHVMLSTSLVILSEAKNLSLLGVNSAKHLPQWLEEILGSQRTVPQDDITRFTLRKRQA